eukprot:TRINITY_DN12077_c0_g1_i1.p1 TRINITY_DN12077_c0_g1~~TRINITY_DN12077_c0_g1_i1.p1  ORF type:complete len:293 (-),score=75.40 TRINITY_DN12077_c0_g1_i1:160-1038(-)
MTRFLPPHLRALFAARPPIPFEPPIEHRKMGSYSGIHEYIQRFDPPPENPPEPLPIYQDERDAIAKKKKMEEQLEKIKEEKANWDRHNNDSATDDPYKTLFVGRMDYDITESLLKREFEKYGPVKQVVIVVDKEGKSKGYGFVEFERGRSFREAYDKADGMKINGRRIVVDKEKGRTDPDWLPRRFGGGKGSSRDPKPPKEVLKSRRPVRQEPPRRDNRRGYRGDRRGNDRRRDRRDDRRDNRRRDDYRRDDYRRDDRRRGDNRRDSRRRDDRAYRSSYSERRGDRDDRYRY